MFAVIYRAYICKGAEEEYQRLWNQVARHFIDHRGALGSCLHKADDGAWVAYSRWPDKVTRDASWLPEGSELAGTLNSEIRDVIISLKKCIDKNQPFQEICMEVLDDLLIPKD